MKFRYYISLLICLTLSNCKGQVEEVIRTHEIVKEGKKTIASDEYQNELSRIRNSETTIRKLVNTINKSDSIQIIKSKDFVLNMSKSLKKLISDSEQLLKLEHNRSDNSYVNKIFIEGRKGKDIKELFQSSESMFLDIASKHKLNIPKEGLPIRLNLSMEEKDQSWEEYSFKGMPINAALPILAALNNDIILTELLMLKQLSGKI